MRCRDKHSSQEKHLRRLERECYRLYKATRDAPIVALERPYQRGWVKTFVLREDVLRRPDVEVFRTVLGVVNQRIHSRTRAFLDANGEPLVLRPKTIREAAWRKLAWSAKHRLLFSYGHWRCDEEVGRSVRNRTLILGFKLTRSWWLEEQIQPQMITHRKMDLPAVKSRLAEIEAYMAAREGWHRLLRLHGKSRQWHCRGGSSSSRRAEWDLHQQLDSVFCEPAVS